MKDYAFPTGSGSFTGTLVIKKWSNTMGLICCFDTATGEKYKFIAWYNPDNSRTYRPKQSDLALDTVELGSVLYVEYDETKTGKTR